MAENKIIRQGGHLYHFQGRFTTRKGAEKRAKSWQAQGSLTLVKTRKAKFLFPTSTKTIYLLYATRSKIKRGKG